MTQLARSRPAAAYVMLRRLAPVPPAPPPPVTASERELVRLAVAAYFGGSLVTTDAGTCYQGGPLTASGLGTFYPYTVRGVPDEYYTAGQPDGQNWGCVMSTTKLERVTTRDSYGGATSGWRSRRYAIECEIALICELPHIEVAGAGLDNLIDAMFSLLAADRNLGTKAAYVAGTSPLLIIQAGEGKGGQGGPGFRDLTEKFEALDAEKGRYAAMATVSFEVFTMVAS